jgi:hypothetical protein
VRRLRTFSPDCGCPRPGVSVEAVLAGEARRDHRRADARVRPAWLDHWKRWTTLPAVRHGNLLHRRRQSAAPRRAALHRRDGDPLAQSIARGAEPRCAKAAAGSSSSIRTT